jgi:hypothetical protein
MAPRQLVIACPPLRGKRIPPQVHTQVDDQTPIGPWLTTLAAHLGYPLVDSFGTPVAYRLRSVSGERVLPASGRFAEARFPSGSTFLLEPETFLTRPMQNLSRSTQGHPPDLSLSRRALLHGGTVAAFSLFGLGSGMATGLAQHLLQVRSGIPAGTSTGSGSPLLRVQTIFSQHQQTVRTVTWAPDAHALATGGNDALVLLWKPDGTILQTLDSSAPVRALAWSPDGRQLAVGAATTVSFFDAQGGVLLAANAAQHTASITALGWTNVPGVTSLVISAGLDKTAWVWNGQTHRPQVVFRHHTAVIEALSILAETVATASQGGVTRIWQALSGQESHGYYASSQQPNRSVAFSSQGALAVGSEDGSIALWNDGRTCMQQVQDAYGLHCLDQAHRLQDHTQAVRALAFSPDGKLLATGGDDHQLILWSMHNMTPLLMQPQQDALAALAWSPSGRLLAGALGTRVALWQIHE